MAACIQDAIDFYNYWWFRYLMVTELYMVEKWERVTIHIIFAILFLLFWYFNYSILTLISAWLGIPPLTKLVDYQAINRTFP